MADVAILKRRFRASPTFTPEIQKELLSVLGTGHEAAFAELECTQRMDSLAWMEDVAAFMAQQRVKGRREQRLLKTALAALKTADRILRTFSSPDVGVFLRAHTPAFVQQLDVMQRAVSADLAGLAREQAANVGRPRSPAFWVGYEVAETLARHGIPPTSGETGRFVRVLEIMLRSMDDPAVPDLHGVTKAVIRFRRGMLRSMGDPAAPDLHPAAKALLVRYRR
jgi:hypothetical protein